MSLTSRRRRWAYSLIRKAKTPPPTYGSAAWFALPEGDDTKIAAVVIAAECWAVDGDAVPERLRRELADQWHADKHSDDADYQARVVEHREHWRHLAVVKPRYPGQQVRPLEEIGADFFANQKEPAK